MDPAIRIRDLLLADLLDGTAGQRGTLAEFALIRRFRAPRSAVRRALASLTEAGVLTRARRVGTVAAAEYSSYHEGRPLRFRTDNWEVVPCPPEVAAELEIEPGEAVTVIDRSTHAGDSVIDRWTIWTVLDFGSYAATHPDGPSWFEIAGAITGESGFTASRRTISYPATAADAQLLDVQPGAPMLFIARTTRTHAGRPIDRSYARTCSERLILDEVVQVSVPSTLPSDG